MLNRNVRPLYVSGSAIVALKQYVIVSPEYRESDYLRAFALWERDVIRIPITDEEIEARSRCCSNGFVLGADREGYWTSGVSNEKHPKQWIPIHCRKKGCPVDQEGATKQLASYSMWRWSLLFENARKKIAVDKLVITVPQSWRETVSLDEQRFHEIVAATILDLFKIAPQEELFFESTFQDWGSSDLSGEAIGHIHVTLSNLIFDSKTHLLKGCLPLVGRMLSKNALKRFDERFLQIFNFRMRQAFKDLPRGEALDVNRTFISEELRGTKIARAQLHFSLGYNYRAPLQDIFRWFVHNGSGVFLDGRHDTYNPDYGTLIRGGGRLTESRRKRLSQLMIRTEVDADNSKLKNARRYERTRSWGAASKGKISKTLKALANCEPRLVF